MKKRLLALLLALIMTLGMLPGAALAAEESSFEDFFTGLNGIADVTNDSNYPFIVDTDTEGGPWLQSGKINTTYTRSTLTLTMKQAATLTFDYKISSPSSSGLEVKNGITTLYTYSEYGSGIHGCNGEKTGTAKVQAEAGDKVTISYYRGYVYGNDTSNDCIWLKNFQATFPPQVIFHANDGTEKTANQGVFETGKLMSNPFTYMGHVFKGWTTSAESGQIAYPDGGEITITEDTHLYAVWAPVYDLTFAVEPEDADFALYGDGDHTEVIDANPGGGHVYTLENGTYYWAASQFGYKEASGSATVENSNRTVDVTLTADPVCTVTFAYDALIDGAAIENGTLEVKTGDRVIEAEANSDGLVYELPVGRAYTWTFKSANYAKQTGEIDLTGETAAGTREVSIPLAVKTAWGGGDDVIAPSKDADGVYQIGSGAELAWLAQEVNAGRGANYNVVLTKDIDLGEEAWTPIGKAYNTRYAGTFDGQDFTVDGLNITGSTSGNYGLFGYVEGGTIRNMMVDGAVNITGSGSSSSSYGVAGIVGQFNGTTGRIENCVNKATVNGPQNVGGVVGYLVGGYSENDKAVRNCANLSDIASVGAKAGGVIGYVCGPVTVENCYNTGNVSGGGWYNGGITAYLSHQDAKIKNCYTTGEVTGSGSAAAIGKNYSGTVENLYYLSGTGTDDNATAKTEAEMQSAAFVAELGAAFQKDMPTPINGGYPILTFQDTTPKYEVTVTVTPADAVVTMRNADEEIVPAISSIGGTTTYRLPDGTYTYSVSAFGYITESQNRVTVDGGTEARTVTLTPAGKRAVSFRVTPSDAAGLAQITVTYDGDGRTVPAGSDGVYLLPTGGYHYTVRARGYAKAEGELSVNGNESGTQYVNIALQASTQWDGTSKDAVVPNSGGVYEISSGAELAWFADQVNSGAGTSWNALLTDDIALGDEPWTPIGNTSSRYYSGIFDGGGYTVSGLKVSGAEIAGLFGYTKGTPSQDAELENMVVEGSVEGEYAGGIVGRVDYAVIHNCGNEATVTGSKYAGGIVGQKFNYDSTLTIGGCYNMVAVSGTDRAGGILGFTSGSADVSHCYNTGTVTAGSSGYAGGIRASSGFGSGATESCYHTGTASGGMYNGPILSGSGSATDCFYLGDEITGAAGTAKTAEELKNLVDTLNGGADPAVWKSGGSLNQGYPVLVWQTGGADEPGSLNAVTNAVWASNPNTGLLTGVATWDAVPHADHYTVILWDYWAKETETGSENGLTAIATVENVKETQFDFTETIAENGPSWYYFTVTPMAAEGSGYVSGKPPVWNSETQEGNVYAYLNLADDSVCYRYYDQLDQPTGLRWMGTFAHWDFVEGAAGYMVAVYRVDDNNVASYIAGGIVDGAVNQLNCSNYFAVGGRYVFTIMGLSEEYVISGVEDKNSPESKLSSDDSNGGAALGIYTAETLPQPDPGEEVDRTGWTAISSAEQWMELANVKDEPVSNAELNTSKQSVEWAKKYYLTADLDFSTLSAADQARTKSIGNVTNRFTGILDGNGHKITGLTLSNYDSGLFAYISSSGQVIDVTIEGANVLFSDNAAVLALNNYGLIRDCAVINCNITADTGAVLGGMVSRNYGVIQESYVQGGTLTSNTESATGHAGFVGSNETGGVVERCWSSMAVNTKSDYAGGFVGLSYGGTIRNCFALGSVTARSYSGGFAGRSVYSGNTYENCYAAGLVAVSGDEGHGFIGGSKPDSAFRPDLSAELENCYYNSASAADAYATGKRLSEMQSAAFLTSLSGTSGVWLQRADQNGGLPFLAAVPAPVGLPTKTIMVELALATYDKEHYTFSKLGDTVSITLESNGNTRVVDLMDAAVEQGKLTYSYETTPSFGRYIHTINGYAVEAPDGWMFTIDDALSNVSASLATIEDGDRILWFEGTTENHFQGPAWDSMSGEKTEWTDIGTVEELLALANSSSAATLAGNYRLTAELDFKNAAFPGIGTENAPFTGLFDGQGHTVSNLTVNGVDCVGFFGAVKGATVKNLNLANLTVTGTGSKVGALIGWAQVELDKNDMAHNVANLVGNCTVSGTVSGASQTGGLVGLNDGAYDTDTLFSIASAVDKCVADVAVTGTGSQIGGLVGQNNGVITKSAAHGRVNAENATVVGGFVGDSYSGDIYDSHAGGDVTGKSTVGGFAGSANGTVKNCYSLGAVSGEAYTGGFAGSLGAAENVISAGQVTVTGNSSTGYNGGFAGTMNGAITGVPNQISIKNAYGNCAQPNGTLLNLIGNSTAYPSDAQKAVLREMALETGEAVGAKLYEMFGVNLTVSDDLVAEADKYADTLAAAQSSGELSLLKAGQSAGEGVTVSYTVSGDYLTGGDHLTLVKRNDTAATLSIPVTLVLTSQSGDVYRKTVQVLLPVAKAQQEALMDAIASAYLESKDGWTAMDMAVYKTLEGKTHALSDAARQNVLNLLINEAAGEHASVSDRARVEIVLRALGIDSSKLYPVNSNEAVSNAALLGRLDVTSGGYYAAPWLLLADLQGNLKLTDSQTASLIQLLSDNVGDGLFGYEWEGVTYTDLDTAGAALAALARFYDSNADAKTVVDQILTALPEAMDETGSLGNANSDAMVILGLLALGQDPAALKSGSGASLVDGLLSYVNPSTNRFQFNGLDNALATEQGFRALVALGKANGKAYNLYDFSANPVVPGRATGEGEVEIPDEPDGNNPDITVTVTIKADTGDWLAEKDVTVKQGSTVYHAFVKALDGTGITQTGAATGYVKSITKDGKTLAEFSHGENSGWLYQVNSLLPNVGLTAYRIHSGDAIVFYFTTDWTQDPDAGSAVNPTAPDQKAADAVKKLIDAIGTVTKDSGTKIEAARTAYDKLTEPQKKLVTNYSVLTKAESDYAQLMLGVPFTDVAEHWALEAIRYAFEHKLMDGVGKNQFVPDGTLNRAMLVTILWRLEGSPAVNDAMEYSDVTSGTWYTEAIRWASSEKIVSGMGSGKFAPEQEITREQMAVMLYNYAKYKAYDTTQGGMALKEFGDYESISDWARPALGWANAAGLVTGRTEKAIAPVGTATRAEAATILMRFLQNIAN